MVDIDHEIESLGILTTSHDCVFTLRDEGSVSAFLGIQMKKLNDSTFHLTQTGPIAKILSPLDSKTAMDVTLQHLFFLWVQIWMDCLLLNHGLKML